MASSRVEGLKTVFSLSRLQREEFHYNEAICCQSEVQLVIQDVYSVYQKLILYECMLSVDCLVMIARIFS